MLSKKKSLSNTT